MTKHVTIISDKGETEEFEALDISLSDGWVEMLLPVQNGKQMVVLFSRAYVAGVTIEEPCDNGPADGEA